MTYYNTIQSLFIFFCFIVALAELSKNPKFQSILQRKIKEFNARAPYERYVFLTIVCMCCFAYFFPFLPNFIFGFFFFFVKFECYFLIFELGLYVEPYVRLVISLSLS